jgi:hypothetical protein
MGDDPKTSHITVIHRTYREKEKRDKTAKDTLSKI